MVSRIRTEASGEDRLRILRFPRHVHRVRHLQPRSRSNPLLSLCRCICSPSNARPRPVLDPLATADSRSYPYLARCLSLARRWPRRMPNAQLLRHRRPKPIKSTARCRSVHLSDRHRHSIKSKSARLNVPPSCSESLLFDCWALLSSATCCKSAPAQKPRPAPVSTTTRPSDLAHLVYTSLMPCINALFIAFMRSDGSNI